jgi:hypothetical protein
MKVDMQVNGPILKNTIKCKNNFSCLSGEKECLCEVRALSGYNSLLIYPKSDRDCFYLNPFGSSFFCFCPTRNEIYNRYKI